jgi:segregation and condensation protein B
VEDERVNASNAGGNRSDGGNGGDELGLDQFLAPADDQGLSLDALSRTYAQLLGSGEDPYPSEPDADGETSEPGASEASGPLEQESDSGPPGGTEPDDGCQVWPGSILEAMLFVGHPTNEPLTARQIAALMRGVSPAEVDELVAELNQNYLQQRAAYHIVSVGAGYQMALRPELSGLRDKFHGRVKAARLSQQAVDVLAVVAYHQPATRDEIERLRGKPVSAVLAQMVRRELLSLERDPDRPKAPRYRTTNRFLHLFGLESLDDLPRSQELDPKT